jgi:hypothetical protein
MRLPGIPGVVRPPSRFSARAQEENLLRCRAAKATRRADAPSFPGREQRRGPRRWARWRSALFNGTLGPRSHAGRLRSAADTATENPQAIAMRPAPPPTEIAESRPDCGPAMNRSSLSIASASASGLLARQSLMRPSRPPDQKEAEALRRKDPLGFEQGGPIRLQPSRPGATGASRQGRGQRSRAP